MEKDDYKLAIKLNNNLNIAIDTGNIIAGKLKQGNLKKYLFSHLKKYEDLKWELNDIVETNNQKLPNENIAKKAFIKLQAQLTSLKNKEESDYIESFIKGSEMGIDSSTSLLLKYDRADKELKDIAFSIQSIELENINKLKDYLKRSDY